MFYTWYEVSRRDPRVVGLYARHYSSKKNNKTVRDWLDFGITAPGESIVLMTADASALFVWLKQKYVDNDQVGVNCAVFRNEGKTLSSSLILEAEEWACKRWPGERLYTYVDAGKVRHKRDPGRCFKRAGWEVCGYTKGGLVILEKEMKVT